AAPTRPNLAGPTPGLAIAGQPVRPTSAPPSLGGDSAGGLASGADILEVLARHEADIRRHARKPLTLGRLETGHRLLTSPHAGQARSRHGSTAPTPPPEASPSRSSKPPPASAGTRRR